MSHQRSAISDQELASLRLCPKNVILSEAKNLKWCRQDFLRNNLAACYFRPFILPAGEFRVTLEAT
jgi:hypothetical protein